LCRIYNGLYGLVIPLSENDSAKEIGRKETTKETIQADGHVINQEALNNDRLAGFILKSTRFNVETIHFNSNFRINLFIFYLFIYLFINNNKNQSIKTKLRSIFL